MLNFQEAKKDLALDTGPSGSPLELMVRLDGPYRLDRFDQSILEDLRQRLSRQGVSLSDFCKECIPAIYDMLNYAKERGIIFDIPKLFHYNIKKTELSRIADSWVDGLNDHASLPTVNRYRKILETWILPKLGALDIRSVDKNIMEKYKQEFFASGGTESTFLFHQRIIYGIIDHAVSEAIQSDKAVVHYLESKHKKPRPVPLRQIALQWINSQEEVCDMWKEREVMEKYFIPLLGQSDIGSSFQRRLIEYRKELAHLGLGEKTFLSHVSILNILRKYAFQQGYTKKLPLLKAPKRKEMIERLPDERERAVLMQYWTEEPDSLILCLASHMGLRNDEIRMLQWKDIHFHKKAAAVGARSVPIPDSFLLTLEHITKTNGKDGYVVVTAQKKIGPVSMAYLIVAAQKLFQKYGIEHIRLDDLRNDYIIRQLQIKAPEIVAQQCGYPNVNALLEKFVDFIPSARKRQI